MAKSIDVKAPQMSSKSIKSATVLKTLDARVPYWDPSDLISRDCPVCNRTISEASFQRPDGLFVSSCTRCDAFFVNPAPSPKQLENFYKTYHSSHFGGLATSPKEIIRQLQLSRPLDDTRIRWLSSHFKINGARALDIGSGKGQFLFLLQSLGAFPYGVELDRDAIRFAKAIGIRNIHNGTIETFETDMKFDIITLNDLIEHPLLPMNLLRCAVDLLEENGVLLIWTPNGERINFDVEKITLRVDLEHMQYFTTKTINHLSKALSLNILHLECLGFPALAGMEKSLEERQNNNKYKQFAKDVIKRLPGFDAINKIRRNLSSGDDKVGIYHLFCVLQRANQLKCST